MNKSVFLFNGCSQTAGREVLKDDQDAPDDVTRNHTWAKHLQMHLNPNGEFHNIARSGASNESIFRTTVDWLAANQDKHQGTFAAIMWTEPNRFEFEDLKGFRMDLIAATTQFRSNDEKYLNRFINEYLAGRKIAQDRSLNLMLSLECILKAHNIPFIYLNGFNNHHFYNVAKMAQSPFGVLSTFKGKDRFFKDEYSFCHLLQEAGFKSTPWMHYLEEGHKYYADLIYNNLGDML